MKLLLLNGNTDPAITERMAQGARGMCGHEIMPVTARFGARYIASRAAAAVAAHAVLDALAHEIGRDNAQGFDAAIIGCFGDPGLEAARECFPIPIIGMADAAIFAALRIAPRVAVLTGGAAWVPMLEEFFLLRGLGPDKVRVAASAGAQTGDVRDVLRPRHATNLADNRPYPLIQLASEASFHRPSAAAEHAACTGCSPRCNIVIRYR